VCVGRFQSAAGAQVAVVVNAYALCVRMRYLIESLPRVAVS
jgi:hypothetical protein